MLLNRGKKSIAIDLKAEDGVAMVRELAKASDVVVENFRPGVAARLGLDHATLRANHHELVYASNFRLRPGRTLRQLAGIRSCHPSHERVDEHYRRALGAMRPGLDPRRRVGEFPCGRPGTCRRWPKQKAPAGAATGAFFRAPRPSGQRTPLLGEDTDAVLKHRLGLSHERLADLRDRKVIA